MRLLLPVLLEERLLDALRRAGRREIGGILMGEHVSENLFRIVECTVQARGGTASRFVRQPEDPDAALKRFAEEHGHDHHRFNYLGEWHSHPCHPLVPSGMDIETMTDIVEAPDTGANFAVLLLVRLDRAGGLAAAAQAHLPGSHVWEVAVVIEQVLQEDAARSAGRPHGDQ